MLHINLLIFDGKKKKIQLKHNKFMKSPLRHKKLIKNQIKSSKLTYDNTFTNKKPRKNKKNSIFVALG